jgi:5-methylcytosine-specific restriction endonuclease McrA
LPAVRTRRARAARKRKRRMAGVEHDLSPAEWSSLQAAWGGCAYCGAYGVPLQKDCVLPISRGGRYTVTNVVPACGSCNASKCNDEVTGWLRRKKLDERAFLVRHAEVVGGLVESGSQREQDPLEPGLGRTPTAAPSDLS